VRTIGAPSTEDTDLRAMVFDMAKPATLVGAVNFFRAPLQISYDGGLHWQTVPKPFPMPQDSFVECLASGWL
jgi:hypothetical protein